LKENYNLHLEKSLEYYLSINNPALGLLFYLNNKNKIEETECIYKIFVFSKIIFLKKRYCYIKGKIIIETSRKYFGIINLYFFNFF